jgi:LPXTG-motif cell wall-anchored protein
MSRSRVAAGLAALALSGLGVFGLQSPAYATHKCPDPKKDYPVGCKTEGHGGGGTGGNTTGGNTTGGGGTTGGNTTGGGGTTEPGGTAHCHADGMKPKTKGPCTLHSVPIFLGTLTADDAGVMDGDFPLPLGVAPGAHQLVVSGVDPQGRPRVVTTALVVKPATAPGTSGKGSTAHGNTAGIGGVQLPRTGTEIAVVALLGAGLVVVGGAAVTSGRRRRTMA